MCHSLEQGGNEKSGRCSLLTPALSTRGREKGGKGRETYKLSVRTALLIILIILIIREIRQNIQNQYRISQSWVPRVLASCQQLPGSTRKFWTGLSSRWELDSGMHGSESGSWSQAGQWAGSFSEAGRGQKRDPHDAPASNWVWRVWHGIPRGSISGHLLCLPLPASVTLYDSSFSEPIYQGPWLR